MFHFNSDHRHTDAVLLFISTVFLHSLISCQQNATVHTVVLYIAIFTEKILYDEHLPLMS